MGKCIKVYVDDMVVKPPSHQQHAQDLSIIFSALRQYNLRLNLENCVFGIDCGKFLGLMLTQRGIEANPEKCTAIIEIQSPNNIKDVQRLIGRLTAITRFLPKLPEQTQPIIQLLKKFAKFSWNAECELVFHNLKTTLTSPPILHKSDIHQPLLVYITATDHTISATLVQEITSVQHPVYFVTRTLQGPETRYPMVEKLALSLVHAARRPCPYFQNHNIIVKTNYPSKKYSKSLTLQAECCPESWNSLNSTFVMNHTAPSKQVPTPLRQWPSTHPVGRPMDTLCRQLLESKGHRCQHRLGRTQRYSHWKIPPLAFKTSNNQAEYEAILDGLSLAREVDAKTLVCKTDSKLMWVISTMNSKSKMPLFCNTIIWSVMSSNLLSTVYASSTS